MVGAEDGQMSQFLRRQFLRNHTRTLLAVGLTAALVSGGAIAYATSGTGTIITAGRASAWTLPIAGGSVGDAAGDANAGVTGSAGAIGSAGSSGASSPTSGRSPSGRRTSLGVRSTPTVLRLRSGALRRLVFGRLTGITTSGGALGAGTISLAPPDGQSVTLSLAPKTRFLAYHGPGMKATAEPAADLTVGDVVAVAVRARGARGAGGSLQPGSGTARASVTAASVPASLPASARVAILVVDLGPVT